MAVDSVNNSYRNQYPTKDGTEGTGKSAASKTNNINAIFADEDDNSVKVEDFLNLMVAQLQNQDFMNPTDDTQFITQMAQFSTLQQMQEMAEYAKTSYAMSMVGKEVTVARINVSGDLTKVTGPVEKVSLAGGEYTVTVAGKAYKLNEIMEVSSGQAESKTGVVDLTGKVVQSETQADGSIKLVWPKATDKDGAAVNDASYTVYYSKNSAMDTAEDVEKNGVRLGEANRKGLTEETIAGLDPNTTYYINVVVTEAGGIKSVYQKAVVHTGETEG